MTSVDPDEVAYYQRLADLWWDERGPFWPLHRLNELRVRYILDVITRHFGLPPGRALPLAGITLLDVGCGGGILSEALARLGAQVHGIDVVERNIAVARRHAAQSELRVDYDTISVEALAQRGKRYDAVLALEVVEHVADLPLFLEACCCLVRPGGLLLIATLNRTPMSWLFGILGAEYILRWLPRGTHQWKRFPRPEELERLLKQSGLSVVATTGVRVNPFSRRFALTRYRGINYLLVAEKPVAASTATAVPSPG
jgi:2-polyprenyl-6-hydroxyphenyl methylase/3-demethylubiquinone-9 3-methyltransferase